MSEKDTNEKTAESTEKPNKWIIEWIITIP